LTESSPAFPRTLYAGSPVSENTPLRKAHFPRTPLLGISYTFFLFAVIGALSFLFIWTMVPETRGRTLEQLEEHFREKFGEAGSRGPETAGAK
jgi:hypothetical protein